MPIFKKSGEITLVESGLFDSVINWINRRLDIPKRKTSELENRSIENIQTGAWWKYLT